MAIGKYKVPFRNDSLQHWVPSPRGLWPPNDGSIEWRDNVPFEATISFVGMNSGYSAKYLTVRDENGNSYPMFVVDALGVLQYGSVSEGKCFGRWCGQKRGQNYGIRLVKPDE